MRAVVLTVDQRSSRTGPDRVPELLVRLKDVGAEHPVLLPFERTAGDEVQGLLVDAAAVSACLEAVLRSGQWNVGVGVGDVEEPLPDSTRAARGAAYLLARDAVTGSKRAPSHVRVEGDDAVAATQLETVLMLWASVIGRRSDRGWEVADLLDRGLSHEEAARRLGITQPAVSQRAAAAGLTEGRRAATLCAQMVEAMLRS